MLFSFLDRLPNLFKNELAGVFFSSTFHFLCIKDKIIQYFMGWFAVGTSILVMPPIFLALTLERSIDLDIVSSMDRGKVRALTRYDLCS